MIKHRKLGPHRGGAALMEFGLIAPVLLLLLMGAFDLGHRLYARAVLQGAVQKAARDTGLEGGTLAARQTAIDDKVRAQVKRIHKGATITITRRSYRDFAKAASPAETFTDSDGNGVCNGEPFDDINRNGVRDMDIGVAGQGGAEDAVIYSVRVQYKSVTPVFAMAGINDNVDFTSQTVLRNQPYSEQGSDLPPLVGTCPA